MAVTLFPRKISTQTMGFNTQLLEDAAAGQKSAVPVLRIWGIVSSATPGVSQYGSFIKFGGELAALNLLNGDEARSSQLLLPTVAEGIVKSLFDKAQKDGGSAQIALEVCVEENISAKGGTKFRYVAKPLIEYSGEDALAEMAKQLPAPKIAGQLPAPKKGKK